MRSEEIQDSQAWETRTTPAPESSTGGVEVHNLGQPEAVVTYPLDKSQQVWMAGTIVSRTVLQPGWNSCVDRQYKVFAATDGDSVAT